MKIAFASNKIMQFSKFNGDPQLLEAMRAAFDRVCDVLQLNGDREDPLTQLVVTKIVELAKAGELDPVRLRSWPNCRRHGEMRGRTHGILSRPILLIGSPPSRPPKAAS
jgi:hypothetical protein